MSSERWAGPWAAAALSALVFGPWALRCGLYLDDYTFFLSLPQAPWSEVWQKALHYVPGRNLFIPLLAGLLKAASSSVLLLHLFCTVAAALNSALAYLLYRRLGAPAGLAFPAAAFFAVMAHHGETQFMVTHGLQCLLPVTAVLLAFLTALSAWRLGARLAAGSALMLAAMLTYDQVFFLWPLWLGAAALASAPRQRKSPLLAATAAAGVLLALGYVLLRHYSPHSSGGRPVILLSAIPIRAAQSLVLSLLGTVPLPRLTAWAGIGWALGMLAATGVSWLQRRFQGHSCTDTTLLRLGLFGAAWWLLSYLPNYFWHISPRHNYLPSVGWVLALAAAAAWKPRWWTRSAAVLCFTLSVASDVSEGSQWAASKVLHDRYLEEAARFDPAADNVFLVGAPRVLGKAPAFNLYHDHALSAALQRGGGAPMTGDNQLTATARGAFYFNELKIWGPEAFYWRPYSELNVVAYSAEAGFRCLAGVDVQRPSGEVVSRPFKPTQGCGARLRARMDAGLVEAVETKAPAAQGSPVPGIPGLRLVSHDLSKDAEGSILTLEWRSDGPLPGALVLVPMPLPKAAMLAPFIDDERPATSWKAGRSIRETYRLAAGPSPRGLKLYLLEPDGRAVQRSELAL